LYEGIIKDTLQTVAAIQSVQRKTAKQAATDTSSAGAQVH
jgi:hypothetical protein